MWLNHCYLCFTKFATYFSSDYHMKNFNVTNLIKRKNQSTMKWFEYNTYYYYYYYYLKNVKIETKYKDKREENPTITIVTVY